MNLETMKRKQEPKTKRCVKCHVQYNTDNVEALQIDDGNIICVKCYTQIAHLMEDN